MSYIDAEKLIAEIRRMEAERSADGNCMEVSCDKSNKEEQGAVYPVMDEPTSYMKGLETGKQYVLKYPEEFGFTSARGRSKEDVPSRETILAIWELGNEWKENKPSKITQLKYIQEHWKESSYYDKLKSSHQNDHGQSAEEPYPSTLDEAIKLYYDTYGNGKGGFDYLSLPKFQDIVETFVNDYSQRHHGMDE